MEFVKRSWILLLVTSYLWLSGLVFWHSHEHISIQTPSDCSVEHSEEHSHKHLHGQEDCSICYFMQTNGSFLPKSLGAIQIVENEYFLQNSEWMDIRYLNATSQSVSNRGPPSSLFS